MTPLELLGTLLGIGVAGFGVIRGGLEIYDRLAKRRIAVERGLTGAADIGNHVTLINLSDKPLLVSAWDVVWARWRLWGRKVTIGAADGDDDSHVTVPPHDRIHFNFVDQYHFDWGAKMRERYGRLYFRLWVAGHRRAKWFRLL